MKKMIFAALTLLVLPVHADDLTHLDTLAQAQFSDMTGDLTGVLAYRAIQPADPYGVIGFNIGLDASAIKLNSTQEWKLATGSNVSTLPMTKISVTKGLPFGFDIGGFLAKAPGSNVSVYGAQVRYALVEGGIATPAVGLRAAVTQLKGVDQLDAKTRSLDLSISKGLGPITPYIGYGRVWSSYDPIASTGLNSVDRSDNRSFAGFRFSLIAIKFTVEADRTGDTSAYSLQLGFGF